MNVALILASGNGSRITKSNIPKQFIKINKKPIIIYAIEKFIKNKNINNIVVVCHPEYISQLSNDVIKYFNDKKNIFIVPGGTNRNESIKYGLNCITTYLNPKDDDLILTHDAARIFVNDRIINDNIKVANKFGSASTVVNAIDTIIKSNQNKKIDSILKRDQIYHCQTPQTFKYKIINECYINNIFESTDACGIVSKFNYPIHLVNGDDNNFKITNNIDLIIAEYLVEQTKNH